MGAKGQQGMGGLGDKALALRIVAAGILLVLLLWTLLVPQARAQALGGARADAPLVADPELPASDLLLRYEGPGLSFRWSLAPEASLEPALVQTLRRAALARRETAIAEAREAVANPPPGRGPIQAELIESWQAEAETDLLLALSSRAYSYTGGAHGNLLLGTVLWDRGAGRRIDLPELFTDPKAAFATLQPAFCKGLAAERAKRRDGAAAPGFDGCPDVARFPITPVGMGTVTAMKVLVPPYEAGPWAEGSYEISLEAGPIRPFLAPRYLPSFTPRDPVAAGAFAKR